MRYALSILSVCLLAAAAGPTMAQPGACVIARTPVGPAATLISLRVPAAAYPVGITSCTVPVEGPYPTAHLRDALPVTFTRLAIGSAQALRVSPGHGTVETYGGVVRYTPDPGYLGADGFSIDLEQAGPGGLRVSTLNFVVTTY